ncbi:MAG: hypothetical protein A3H79_04200 [Candidatus Levybacteria bacterium RIFCSPLOWO2_02_FULL_36_8b]|uniref:Glutamine amidotransferase type-2 domain-containing protein n=1 Tax=Candidatus Roizmanbacteria bacterium RIFCSPHIGHO2_12_FULL_44_10 TaxID=1802054 RepID=A0A1F7IB32_9BACT|nr:MAG: hypothetical protein A3H79_04200 [Candidatus Levybacteria bacterium RIFCSPLOWO2_02_FULL_36_8b]OGK40576.1 MAG: hypothetical protein A3F34_01725 [Candidatus Roizmanbacteria bacterium RIFCSPHIGHO2_12_FULL_44_10]
MCRFLLIKSKQPFDANELFLEFTKVCKNSLAPDGDRQADGWGISWLDESNSWQIKKSLKPIWNDGASFKIPKSRTFTAHARSASFPNQKGIIDYNQPYTNGEYSFLFNGALFGVKFDREVAGKIGAQKIWTLLQEELKHSAVNKALENVRALLEKHSTQITGMNIALASKKNITALCRYQQSADYFTLHYHDGDIKIISSEKLPSYDFTPMKNSEIIQL